MKKQLVFLVVALLLITGCVSRGTYDLKAKEAQSLAAKTDDLQAQVKGLTAEVEGLKTERTALQAALEKEKTAHQQDKEAAQKDVATLQAKVNELSPKAEKAEQLEKATQTYEDLRKKLEKEIQEGQVQITEMKNRLTVTMVDQILFASGSARVGKRGKAVLDKVVTILKDVKDKRIEVDGHTDNVPIVSSLKTRFPTNWELSTARATEVVRYLQDPGGIDPHLLSASGFGEFQPVASNDIEEGRHKNRRIEIVLLPLLKQE
ncbi:MAG: OmpA family protein [Betaproteobacteria bacterium]